MKKYPNNLPNNKEIPIEYVMKKMGIKFEGRTEVNTPCPFCQTRRKVLHYDLTKGRFRCNKCEESGGSIKLYKLINELEGNSMSFKEAKEKLLKEYTSLDKKEKVEFEKYKELMSTYTEKQISVASLSLRDKYYRELLSRLDLLEEHKRDLLKRGLSEKDIKDFMFKSVPQKNLDALGKEVAKAVGSVPRGKKGIPGFYGFPNNPTVAPNKPGYFVPIMTAEGYISGMQIRHDPLPENASEEEKINYAKYKAFESKKFEGGCSSSGIENIHYPFLAVYPYDKKTLAEYGINPDINEIFLTEGGLKADIAYTLSELPFMAILGVTNTRQLSDELKKLKMACNLKTVHICLDMDYMKNVHVEKALVKIKGIITDCDLDVDMRVWPEKYKGVDDYLLARKKKEVKGAWKRKKFLE